MNSAWLASIGHGGGNNQSVIRVLKNVGLVATDGSPSDMWRRFKGGDRKALAEGIRSGYADLFATYPDAYQKDAEALRSYFRTKTSLADKAQRLCVQTFQNLCGAADFTDDPRGPVATPTQGDVRSLGVTGEAIPAQGPRAGGVELVVNIQLQLPASADGEAYEKLFEAMAKHLREIVRIE